MVQSGIPLHGHEGHNTITTIRAAGASRAGGGTAPAHQQVYVGGLGGQLFGEGRGRTRGAGVWVLVEGGGQDNTATISIVAESQTANTTIPDPLSKTQY